MKRATRLFVRRRARQRCEYCRMPELPLLPLQIDHIVAEQHGGTDDPDNLCLACSICNSHKGPNLTGIDSRTGQVVLLFNPRRQRWQQHFRWNGPRIVGRTAVGRATLAVLAMNDDNRIELRTTLRTEGIRTFPGRWPKERS